MVSLVVVNDDGQSNYFKAVSEEVQAGTYYVMILAEDSSGNKDHYSLAQGTAVVNDVPEPPTELEYVSGDWSNTVIKWKRSTTDDLSATSDVCYNVYVNSVVDGPINTHSSVLTICNGSGLSATDPYVSIQLPAAPFQAISDSPTAWHKDYSGYRRILVRAVFNGQEEKNVDYLTIEYAPAGAYVSPRPNVAYIQKWTVSNLFDVEVSGTYDDGDEDGQAIGLRLFVWPDGSDPDWSVWADEQLFDQPASYARGCMLHYTGGSSGGPHWICVRAYTLDGTMSNGGYKQLVRLAEILPQDVLDVTVRAGGG